VVIVQHIDFQFVAPMVDWLGKLSALPVRVIKEGDELRNGVALVAATNDHLVLRKSGRLGYTPEPRDGYYKPSVDVFFESVGLHWNGVVAAVLLTGMGRDGAKGLKSLRTAGAHTIAQDRASCVVYGMPKAAAEINAALEILSLEEIAPRLTAILTNKYQ
jgi:chemotaxis response regulator CheB